MASVNTSVASISVPGPLATGPGRRLMRWVLCLVVWWRRFELGRRWLGRRWRRLALRLLRLAVRMPWLAGRLLWLVSRMLQLACRMLRLAGRLLRLAVRLLLLAVRLIRLAGRLIRLASRLLLLAGRLLRLAVWWLCLTIRAQRPTCLFQWRAVRRHRHRPIHRPVLWRTRRSALHASAFLGQGAAPSAPTTVPP